MGKGGDVGGGGHATTTEEETGRRGGGETDLTGKMGSPALGTSVGAIGSGLGITFLGFLEPSSTLNIPDHAIGATEEVWGVGEGGGEEGMEGNGNGGAIDAHGSEMGDGIKEGEEIREGLTGGGLTGLGSDEGEDGPEARVDMGRMSEGLGDGAGL